VSHLLTRKGKTVQVGSFGFDIYEGNFAFVSKQVGHQRVLITLECVARRMHPPPASRART